MDRSDLPIPGCRTSQVFRPQKTEAKVLAAANRVVIAYELDREGIVCIYPECQKVLAVGDRVRVLTLHNSQARHESIVILDGRIVNQTIPDVVFQYGIEKRISLFPFLQTFQCQSRLVDGRSTENLKRKTQGENHVHHIHGDQHSKKKPQINSLRFSFGINMSEYQLKRAAWLIFLRRRCD